MAKRLTKEYKIQLIETNSELKFISGEIDNFDSKFTVRCICGEEFVTTLRTIKNSHYTLKCKECRNKIARDRCKKDFDIIKKEYEDNGCILLSNESEYKNRRSVLKFVAKCGHEYSSSYMSFYGSKHKMCKKCSKEINKGENAYNWRGGCESERIAFRKTYEFKKWRADVLKRDNYTCQLCKEVGGKLNAHHLDGYNWCIEKRTDEANGVTLCEKCHNEFHSIYGRGNNTNKQFKEFCEYKIKLK